MTSDADQPDAAAADAAAAPTDPTPAEVHDYLYQNGFASKDLFLVKKRAGRLELSLNSSMKPRWRGFVQASLPEIRADLERKLAGWPVDLKL